MINVSYRIEPISVQVLLTALNDGHIKQWRNLEIGRDVMQADRASYITSIMAGIPILPLVFDGTKSPWIVLDGEKRFSLLLGFFIINIQFLILNISVLVEKNIIEICLCT